MADITQFKSRVRLEYTIGAGVAPTRYYNAIKQGIILGRRCPSCNMVSGIPRGVCSTCGVLYAGDAEVKDTGTLTTFCIVNIPFEGQILKIPYVYGTILLDGSDLPMYHLVGDIDLKDVRIGMRLKAVWEAPEKRIASMTAIRYFVPSGEPDVVIDSSKEETR